jgi:hypothetical protein
MSAIVFALLFGLLSGIAGFVGQAQFDAVLLLGLLGLTHMAVIARRKENETIIPQENFPG